MQISVAPAAAFAGLLCLLLGESTAMAYEQPDYERVHGADEYELRRYDAYNVAETTVSGNLRESGNAAFRILAGYIFGDNRASEKMQMTVPVESNAADAGVKMSMTAPVTSTTADDGSYTYRFVMERKYTLDTLPVPNDPRVTLRQVPARTLAVRRYSGRWTDKRYRQHEAALLASLAADGVNVVGEPVFARYNGPFTPWFMRRNEVMVEVEWPPADADSGAR